MQLERMMKCYSGLHSVRVKTKKRGSTRNPVAVDWKDREVQELGLHDSHFRDGILGVLEAMLGYSGLHSLCVSTE